MDDNREDARTVYILKISKSAVDTAVQIMLIFLVQIALIAAGKPYVGLLVALTVAFILFHAIPSFRANRTRSQEAAESNSTEA